MCFIESFANFFRFVTLLKTRLQHRCFLRVSRNFPDCKLKTSKTRARHILKILKIFLEQLFGEHLRRVASTDVIIARFSCKIYLFIKIENNIKDNCFYVYVSFYLLIFLISLNTAIILLETLVFS